MNSIKSEVIIPFFLTKKKKVHLMYNRFRKNNIFLKYKLDSIYDYLVQISSGSARDNLSQKVIQDLEINLPLLETQQKIAKILSDIDDKIEVLHQINDNLAELAKTIYDYWFVQFDFPDENGKPYKTSGGKMVYNEVLKREIPEGWEVKKLGEVIEKISNNILPTEYQNLNYLPIDFLPKRQFYYDKYDLRENALSSLIKFDEDDILLGAMRVYFHRVCNAIEDGISRNTIFVLRPFEKENKNYIEDYELDNQRKKTAGYEIGLSSQIFIENGHIVFGTTYKKGTGARGALKAPQEDYNDGTNRFGIISVDFNFNKSSSIMPFTVCGTIDL